MKLGLLPLALLAGCAMQCEPQPIDGLCRDSVKRIGSVDGAVVQCAHPDAEGIWDGLNKVLFCTCKRSGPVTRWK